jgi:hypothetical protein
VPRARRGLGRPDDALVADGILGSILAFARRRPRRPARCCALPGDRHAARRRLDGRRQRAALGWLAAHAGDLPAAADHCGAVLERWSAARITTTRVWGLRTAAWVFATHDDLPRARACAEALSASPPRRATRTRSPRSPHALGETALREGDADAAARQMCRALELHADLDTPFERAQIALRDGVAMGAAGDGSSPPPPGGGLPRRAPARLAPPPVHTTPSSPSYTPTSTSSANSLRPDLYPLPPFSTALVSPPISLFHAFARLPTSSPYSTP